MNAVLKMTTNESAANCPRCADRRSVWSFMCQREIPCPKCSGAYSLPFDPDALRRLARAERKRMRNRVAVVVVESIAEQQARVFAKLPPELVTTNRVLDRWGSFGSGMPAQNPDAYRMALSPPLDDDTQVIVTGAVDLSMERVREVTYQVYWRGAPMSYVGEKLGMKPRTFGRYVEDCLRVHKERFLASKHSDLVSLIQAQP
jgi:hypothetical protein